MAAALARSVAFERYADGSCGACVEQAGLGDVLFNLNHRLKEEAFTYGTLYWARV